jgi:hypothetical protein
MKIQIKWLFFDNISFLKHPCHVGLLQGIFHTSFIDAQEQFHHNILNTFLTIVIQLLLRHYWTHLKRKTHSRSSSRKRYCLIQKRDILILHSFLSFLPALKQLCSMDSLDFRMEMQQSLRRRMFPTQSSVCETGHRFKICIPASHSSTTKLFSNHLNF